MKHAIFFIVIASLWLPGAARAASMNLTATVKLPSICGNNIREDGEQCDGTDFGVSSCSALGYANGTLSCSHTCTYDVAACTSVATNVFSNSFPVSGGSYNFNNTNGTEVQLVVPPNSATSTIQLFTFVYPSDAFASSTPAPDGASFVGNVYNLNFVTSDGIIVHNLSNAVTVVLPYTDDDVEGLDTRTLIVYRSEDGEEIWHPVSGTIVDPVAHTVTFTTSGFSSFTIFTVFGTPPPLPQSNSESSGSGSSSSFSGSVQNFISYVISPFVPAHVLPANPIVVSPVPPSSVPLENPQVQVHEPGPGISQSSIGTGGAAATSSLPVSASRHPVVIFAFATAGIILVLLIILLLLAL